ncbi:MAG: hypothetical protein IPG45_27215 [Deltaproteobacteria bacterium]|nr:hypothetical protein [Deltaproteobacteria bacterium]
MSGAYEIEFAEPACSRCACCGGLSVRLTRFVLRSQEAFAVYYASYANNHPDAELSLLVSLGDWGDESDPSQRVAFYCRVRSTDEAYEVMLDDAADSEWADAEIMGRKLSRQEARTHPQKADALELWRLVRGDLGRGGESRLRSNWGR